MSGTPPPFVPQPPFDYVEGDIILSASDGIDFRVSRVVLSLLSPVFRDMFRLPQPQGDPEVARLPMAESAVVLDRVLRFWYPGAQPSVDSIDELREILEISLFKYDIQGIIPVGKQYLRAYIDSHPVAVFAIACRHEWKDLAVDAARNTLKLPLRSFDSESPELEYISGKHYHSLLRYHAACASACAETTNVIRWITAPPQDVWFTCKSESCSTNRNYAWYLSDGALWDVRDWFLDYMKAARKAMKVRPLATFDDPELMRGAVKKMATCATCRENGFEQLQRFTTKSLGPKILSVINDVKLNLSF
ncbi:BTB domain-containing protein [Mycena venus]|uniref:BTB domain-containing protein n=1 Tax=Mycena venus TaxID=2733690 RepID=A0A8H7CXM9_9AGAR|nr:BTB domain-containing protein [Mycena venus]